MSTYYYIYCLNCQRSGGFITRQGWGWGNFDIIDTFKFLSFHIERCGHQNIRVISEHDREAEYETIGSEETKYYLESIGNFPRSNDWSLLKGNEKTIQEIDNEWTQIKIHEYSTDRRMRVSGVVKELEVAHKKRGTIYRAFFKPDNDEIKDFYFMNDGTPIPKVGTRYEIIIREPEYISGEPGELYLLEYIKEL